MTFVLARPRRLDLDSFAGAAGLHPDLVRRFVALGLLDAVRARTANFGSRRAAAAAARLQRLRSGFALNYSALGLVVDLLDRVDALEAALRKRSRPTKGQSSWT
jgi:hypothetical protein